MYAGEKKHKNEDNIKDMIVSAYRAGKCDHNGKSLPKDKWGMAGKGSRFMGLIKNDSRPTTMIKLWPRDEQGNLIDG